MVQPEPWLAPKPLPGQGFAQNFPLENHAHPPPRDAAPVVNIPRSRLPARGLASRVLGDEDFFLYQALVGLAGA